MISTEEILSRIHIKKGDITLEDSDAIVNAANPSLLGGGGVDGAIHRAAGPQLLEECRDLKGCPHGEARITKGYDLKARYVIHTPGPIYRGGGNNEKEILTNSYINSLSRVLENNLKSISFPAISTGVYGYPKDEACGIALSSTLLFMKNNDYIIDVNFVLFDNENYQLYKKHYESLQ